MFKSNITKSELRDIIDGMSDDEFARLRYCQEMAGTYLAVGQFESMLISAMHMCDRVKLEKVLGEDISRWQQSLRKQALLQSLTLGSLINILERHPVPVADSAQDGS